MIRIDLPPSCAAYFEEGWHVSVQVPAPPSHLILPDHRAGITAILEAPSGAGAVLSAGPNRQARVVPMVAGGCYAGVALRPGAAPALGIALTPAHRPVAHRELAAALTALAADPSATSALYEVLEAIAAAAPPVDPVVAAMVAAIERDPAAPHLALPGLPLSERQQRRRFTGAVGLSPKAFAATLRLRRAMIEGVVRPGESLAAVATGHGYADQPHFGRAVQAAFHAAPGETRATLQQTRRRFLRDTSETF